MCCENRCRTLHGCVDWNVNNRLRYFVHRVAPYMGAWIEISPFFIVKCFFPSHPTWVRGLKWVTLSKEKKDVSRTLHGCVDWNWNVKLNKVILFSRTLHGCVDWNCFRLVIEFLSKKVAPYMGAWIEMWLISPPKSTSGCRTLHGCVDWNSVYIHLS